MAPVKAAANHPRSKHTASPIFDQCLLVLQHPESPDLLLFVTPSNLNNLTTAWSQASATNALAAFASYSSCLARLCAQFPLLIVLSPSLKQVILDFCRDIISNHVKIFYRALSSLRSQSTVPICNLLLALTNSDLLVARNLLAAFDWSLPALPKILAKPSLKAPFIKFLVNLASSLPHSLRKDLLSHQKLVLAWWKHMVDDLALTSPVPDQSCLHATLEFIKDHIILEAGYKKATRAKLLDENFMHKLAAVINSPNSSKVAPNCVALAHEIIHLAVSQALVFPNDKWCAPQDSTRQGLLVNGKTFRISNRLIYTVLTVLKPWEAFAQLKLVVEALTILPELIAPYTNWLVQFGGGYHDPSLTSWWIGHLLLYTHILQIPFEEDLARRGQLDGLEADALLLKDCILLAPLSRSALHKCLQTNKPLISQLSLQLVLATLTKLDKVLALTLISNRAELICSVYNNLPELAAYIAVYETNGADSKLIKITTFAILSLYLKLAPLAQSLSQAVLKLATKETAQIISKIDSCTAYDFQVLNHCLTIQSLIGQEQDAKWWHKQKEEPLSFFSSLLKVASSELDSFNNENVVAILENLCEEKMLFSSQWIGSPVQALVKLTTGMGAHVYLFLDEVVARAVRSPYKYLDMAHQKFSDCSLFVLAVFEQFKFALAKYPDHTRELVNWLFVFSRYLIVAGEKKSAILKMFDEYLAENEAFASHSSKELLCLDSAGTLPAQRSLTNFILNCTTSQLCDKVLALDHKAIVSDFDFASVVYASHKALDSGLSLGRVSSLLELLVALIGEYLLTTLPRNPRAAQFVTSTDSLALLAGAASEIRHQLGSVLCDLWQQLPRATFSQNLPLANAVFEAYLDANSELWAPSLAKLSWLLSNEQLEVTIDAVADQSILLSIARECISRRLALSEQAFLRVSDIDASEARSLSSQLIDLELIKFSNIDVFVTESILPFKKRHFLLKNLVAAHPQVVAHNLISKQESLAHDQYLLCYMCYSIAAANVEPNTQLLDFYSSVLPQAESLLTGQDFSELKFNELMEIITYGLQHNIVPDKQALLLAIFQYLEKNPQCAFVSVFARFIVATIVLPDDVSPMVNTWIHKLILYITRKFAELDTLSSLFDDFLSGILQLVSKLPHYKLLVWKLATIAAVNTQCQVILEHESWSKNPRYLEYVAALVLAGLKNVVDHQRLIQIFVNNPSNVLARVSSPETHESRQYSALLLHALYFVDPPLHSTLLFVEKVLGFYQGSTRAEDLLIKQILVKLESCTNKSWVSRVARWELADELSETDADLVGQLPLFSMENQGLVVNLNKLFITNSIHDGLPGPDVPWSLSSRGSVENMLADVRKFFHGDITNPASHYTIYDCEFLLLLVVNNEELVKLEKSPEDETPIAKFDLRRLIDSNLLQCIIVCTAHDSPAVRKIAGALLLAIARSINTQDDFKDENVYKAYLCNELLYLRSNPDVAFRPRLAIYFYASLAPLLSNPGHFMYERAYRFVLSRPILKANSLALFNDITLASDQGTESEEQYYRQVSWLLCTLCDGVTLANDLNVIKSQGVVEWALNLALSPFCSVNVLYLIMKFLCKLEQVEAGSDTLVTKYGVLSSLEQFSIQWKSDAPTLVRDQLLVNLQEVAVRLGISVATSKRINEWTSHDLLPAIKRIKHHH